MLPAEEGAQQMATLPQPPLSSPCTPDVPSTPMVPPPEFMQMFLQLVSQLGMEQDARFVSPSYSELFRREV